VPPLVILDEPTTGLDDEHRARVLELVESLCAQARSTVLFVTHREDERSWWADRVRGPVLTLGGP
jgi:molybdate transport system ATP-binding protein